MSIGKAVWYIEMNLGHSVRLDDVSRSSGLSKFHLTRVFGMETGLSIIEYARARRLSVAASKLADGTPDILGIALEAGYGSHEAFTRAFKALFGLTPEQVRSRGSTDQLKLVEPVFMSSKPSANIEPVRYEDYPATRFAGFAQHYKFSELSQIPALWDQFNEHADHIPDTKPSGAWGISFVEEPDENGFDYMAAVELEIGAEIGADYKVLPARALRYAVFEHTSHVSEMNATARAIFDWMAQNGYQHAEPGLLLERYLPAFNVKTGMGGMEIWVPVKPAK